MKKSASHYPGRTPAGRAAAAKQSGDPDAQPRLVLWLRG